MANYNLLIVNEFIFFHLLSATFSSRRFLVIGYCPLFPRSEKLLRNTVSKFKKYNFIETIDEVVPLIAGPWEHPRPMLNNIFQKIIKSHDDYITSKFNDSFPDIKRDLVKQCSSTYIGRQLHLFESIESQLRNEKQQSIKVFGLQPVVGYLLSCLTSGYQQGMNLKIPLMIVLTNLFFGIGVMFYYVFFTIFSVRFGKHYRREVFMAGDYTGDPDDEIVFKLASKFGDVLLIPRENMLFTKKLGDNIEVNKSRRVGGPIKLAALPMILLSGLSEIFLFLKATIVLDTGISRQCVLIPVKRLRYETFFNSVKPLVYWSRDLYNVEHMIRSKEIRKIGGECWGVLHAYLSYCDIYPMFRFLDLDKLFLLSKIIKTRGYQHTWASDMEMIEVSSFRLENKYESAQKKSGILFMCSVFSGEPKLQEIISEIAKKFTDHEIVVQVKHIFANHKRTVQMIDELIERHKNIRIHSGSPYELFSTTRICFSDPSAVSLEAAQCGIPSFIVDIPSLQEVSIYREISEFCVKDPNEAIRKVNDVFDNKYEISQNLNDYIYLGGRTFSDTLKHYFKILHLNRGQKE